MDEVTIPDALKHLVIEDKGDRLDFVGRDRELADFMGHLTKRTVTRQGAEPTTRGTGLLVSAAPGAGKTTLQQEASKRWEKAGIATLELRSDDFENRATLHAGIVRQQLPDKAAKSAKVWTRQWMKRATKQQVKLWTSRARKLIGRVIDDPAKLVVEGQIKLAEMLEIDFEQASGPPTLDLLARCDELFPKGWVLLLDEVQQLSGVGPSKEARAVLQRMCDPNGRQASRIKFGGIWMTGLGDSHAVLDSIDVSRYRRERLGAIEQDAAEELIHRHIQAGAKHSDAAKLIRAWATPLAEQFHIWAHHLVGAAQSAEWVAKHAPHEPQALDWIVARTQLHCQKLYQDKLADVRLSTKDDRVAGIVVRAVVGVNRATSILELGQILVAYGETGEIGKIDQERADTFIHDLVHKGVVEDLSDAGVVVPIPSMSHYIQTETALTPAMRRVLRAHGAEIGEQ